MSVRELMDDPDRHELTQKAVAAALGEKKADEARRELDRQRPTLRS